MQKRKLILGKKEKEILKIVGTGVLVTASMAVPNLPLILAPFFEDGDKKRQTKKIIKKLEEKDVIYLSGDKIELTTKGKKLLEKIDAEEISIPVPDEWDRVWRVVAYDIPDTLKPERDYFRRKLEELDFIKVQESLFAFPYSCKEEIAVFAQSLGLSPYVVFLTTDHLPQEQSLLKRFNILNSTEK